MLMLAMSCGRHDGKSVTHDTAFDEQGATWAPYSVSDTSKVRFSRGNLQYQASTDTWRFAEEQWMFYGYGNEKISPDAEEWIDLFGYPHPLNRQALQG